MPHDVTLITTIAAALGFGLVFGFAATRLRLPALVGYLAAGILIGPATPGFVADAVLSAQLAEIGVMLMMFGVGLHFSLKDLWDVRRVAIPGAVLQIGAATAMGIGLASWWGWSLGGGLVFGLALSVASTVVLLRALTERGILDSLNGKIAVGWLVVEDLVTVLVLVLLPALAGPLGGTPAAGSAETDLLKSLAIVLGQVGAFLAFMLIVGRKLFPWILWQVARTNSRELFTLCVIAAAVGIAFLSTKIFGVSFALGAFFAGVVLRESELSHRAAEETLPLRDAFAVLFFVSVGMLFDPRILVEAPFKVLAVTAIILFGKSVAAFLLVILLRYPARTALVVSASLAQIGEFSFILASLGLSLQLMPQEGQSLILAGAILSISLNPLIFALVDPLERWLGKDGAIAARYARNADPLAELPMSVPQEHLTGHVVLVGYGRVGRHLARQMKEANIRFVVAEQNREIVDTLRAQGQPAVVGNAGEPAVLIQAHIARARMLAIATPDTFDVRNMIATARALNPEIQTIVRSNNAAEAAMLRKEHAYKVFVGEDELARNMADHIRAELSR